MVQEPEGSCCRSSHPKASPPPTPNPAAGPRDRLGQCRESLGGKKLGYTNGKETTAMLATMEPEPSTSRQQAGSVAHLPGQASKQVELLEQLPIDLSSGTNFPVKKRT